MFFNCKRAYKKHKLQLFCKAGFTIRNVVAHLKDPLDPGEKCSVVYKCKYEECRQLYARETERSLGDRAQMHNKSEKEYD